MKTKFSTRMLALVLMLALIVPMLVFTASAEGSATLTFDDTAKRTAFSTTNQVWVENGITFTNDKASSTNNVADYAKPVRLYAKSKLTIEAPGNITKIVFDCNSSSYATALKNSIGTAATVSSDKVTVTLDGTTTSFTVTSLTAQVRMDSLTVDYVTSGGSDPQPAISIDGDNVLQVGGTVELTATLTNLEGEVAWTSSDDNVATVAGGVVTGVAMGTATITASVGEVQQTKEILVYPASADPITIAQALAIANFAGENGTPYTYQIMGTVESIEEYNEQYDNITVTIGDGSGSIYIFRMNGGADLQVGQQIAVSGKLQTYQGTPQVSQYAIYELIVDDSTEAILEALNVLELKMSLAYRYETTVETVTKPSTVTDTLNNAFTGISGTSYGEWSGKTGASGAVYAGQSAGGNSSIQLRSSNSNSGIIIAASGLKIKKITVTWNANTASGRTLDIYGKDDAYTAATDLYNSSNQGTKIASLVYGTKNEVTIDTTETGYSFIGMRSYSGAQYIDSIVIEWEAASGEGETVEQELYSNSQFAFRFGVDAALTAIEGIEAYGLMISAGDKDVYYSTDATSWTQGDELCYITLNLGDIINDLTKLSTKFTVKAYVEVDGTKYLSEGEKTYSVADMIAEYQGLGIEGVAHLYSYLQSNGLI